MNFKRASAICLVIFFINLLGCNMAQEQLNKATAKTITAPQLCDANNLNSNVTVMGYIGASPPNNVVSKPTSSGATATPFFLLESIDKDKLPKISEINHMVFVGRGGGSNEINLKYNFQESTVKTNSGETVPVTTRLKFTGKVINLPIGRQGDCYLSDVMIEKP